MAELPDTLILGMIDGEWAVQAFTSDEHAVAWVDQKRNGPARRRVLLWRVQLANPEPLLVIPPTPGEARHRQRPDGAAVKPSVRRARTTQGDLADGWILTRPPFGFQPTEITRHDTWRAAHESLRTAPAAAAATSAVQVAGYVPGLAAHWGQERRPRWIET